MLSGRVNTVRVLLPVSTLTILRMRPDSKVMRFRAQFARPAGERSAGVSGCSSSQDFWGRTNLDRLLRIRVLSRLLRIRVLSRLLRIRVLSRVPTGSPSGGERPLRWQRSQPCDAGLRPTTRNRVRHPSWGSVRMGRCVEAAHKGGPRKAFKVATADEIKGRAKQAAGDITGKDDLKHEGAVDKAVGKAKDVVDTAGDKAKEAVERVTD